MMMISHNFIDEAKRCCNISKSQRCNDYGVQVINGDISFYQNNHNLRPFLRVQICDTRNIVTVRTEA